MHCRAPVALLALISAACGGTTLSSSSSSPDSGAPPTSAATDAGASPRVDASISTGDASPPPAPTSPPVTAPDGQKFLFEAGYSNFAWGFQYSGIYVTTAGEVYSYSYQGPVTATSTVAAAHPAMSEDEVAARYLPAKLLTTVAPDELRAKLAKTTDTETGALLRISSCADAGQSNYLVWRYDSTSKLYDPVVLGADGDISIRNTVAAADEVIDWLAGLSTHGRSCQPGPLAVCTGGSGCTAATCTNGMLSTCDGKCTGPDRCQSVASCSACASYEACVLDGASAAHCSAAFCAQNTPLGCDCAGAQLCAGGAAWCKGTLAAGFHCEKPSK